ncbi:MAG TPA: hypothetical protein VGF39_11645 [Stellaceae bacterium]
MRMFIALLLLTSSAFAQQIIPLTEWRAQLDAELSRIPMTREAHGQVIAILQNAERQAQRTQMHEQVEQQLPPRQPPQMPTLPPPRTDK